MNATHTHRETILYSENNGNFCTCTLVLIYKNVNHANRQWDRWWNIHSCNAWNLFEVFCGSNYISQAELEMVMDQLNSFTFFLSLTARLPEVCYNQLWFFCHIQIESKCLNSCKFSWAWLQAQNSDGAQRAGAKHSFRCANAASASKPWKYWGLQFTGLNLSEFYTGFLRMWGWSNSMPPFLTTFKPFGFSCISEGDQNYRVDEMLQVC